VRRGYFSEPVKAWPGLCDYEPRLHLELRQHGISSQQATTAREVRETAKHYVGEPCVACASTLRYHSNDQCVACRADRDSRRLPRRLERKAKA
jgi:hypothetical protein